MANTWQIEALARHAKLCRCCRQKLQLACTGSVGPAIIARLASVWS